MIAKIAGSLFVVVALSLVSGCATTHATGPSWEYQTVTGYLYVPTGWQEEEPRTLEESVNDAAEDGWEVVSSGSHEERRGFAIMRRAK